MRFSKNYQAVIILLLVSIGIRLLFAIFQPSITLAPDSYQYYDLANAIAKDPSIKAIINPYRAPLYSLIILFSLILTGGVGAAIGSSHFNQSMQFLMALQSLTAIAGILIFYKLLLLYSSFSRRTAFLITILTSINMLLISWERTLLTESFAISWIFFFSYAFVKTLRKPSLSTIMHLSIVSIIGFYLRSAFLFLPFIAFFLALLRHPRRTVFVCTFIALSLYSAVLVFHSTMNMVNWHYKAINISSEVNLLGKIIIYDLPIESGRSSMFYPILSQYRLDGGVPNPYRFLESYDREIHTKPKVLYELAQFNHQVILANIPTLLGKSLLEIPKSADISVFIKITSQTFLGRIFSLFQKFYSSMQWLSLASIVCLVPSLLSFVKRHKYSSTIVHDLGILAWTHIFLSVLLGYEDYGRLVAPITPLILVFLIFWIKKILNMLFHQGHSIVRY